MKTSSLVLLSAKLVNVVAVNAGFDQESAEIESDYVLRWASAGGGFRNLVTNVAYANVFAQAGLFGDGASSSKFSALSGQQETLRGLAPQWKERNWRRTQGLTCSLQ